MQLNIIETRTYLHAQILRTMLEASGYPSVAAHLDNGDAAFMCLTLAPEKLAGAWRPVVNLYALHPMGLEFAKEWADKRSKSAPPAMLEALRTTARNTILTLLYDVDKNQQDSITVVASEPAAQSTLPVVNHDKGDEHSDGVPTKVDDIATEPVNPRGGGTELRCPPVDVYDSWRPGRDLGSNFARPY